MASAFLRVQTISRANGRSATAAAAYRSASEIIDMRTGEIHDYERKRGVESSHIVLPSGEPEMSSSELWNAAELAENRKNSTVARELIIGLSKEMTAYERQEAVLVLAREVAETHKVGIEVSIHSPRRLSKSEIDLLDEPLSHETFDEAGWPTNGNFHAHILMTTRRLENGELGVKTREWDDLKGRVQCKEKWSNRWVEIQNEIFKKKGISVRAQRGQGDEIHLGPERAQLKREEADTELYSEQYELGVRSLNDEFFIAKREAEKASASENDKFEYEKSRFYLENPDAALRELLDIKRERQQKRISTAQPSMVDINQGPSSEKLSVKQLIDEREQFEFEAAQERLAALRQTYVEDMPLSAEFWHSVRQGADRKVIDSKRLALEWDLAQLDCHPQWPDALEESAMVEGGLVEEAADLNDWFAELRRHDYERVQREKEKRGEAERGDRDEYEGPSF